jgi:hypothetical protein
MPLRKSDMPVGGDRPLLLSPRLHRNAMPAGCGLRECCREDTARTSLSNASTR